MNRIIIILLLGIILSACESEFEVYDPSFSSLPSIYCLIDPLDSVHNIRIGRSFFSNQDPAITSQIGDSIYFQDLNVEVKLIGYQNDTTTVRAYRNLEIEKSPGFFTQDGHSVYSFDNVLSVNRFPLFSRIEISVSKPGLETATGGSDFLPRPTIRWPYVAQQYLYMDSLRPILVQWYGGDWNEVDITFTVMEQYRDSIVNQSVSFEEKTEIIMIEDVVQVTFPYELVVSNLSRLLDPRKDLVRRYFGPVMIKIHTGNTDFSNYMKYKDGLNDFTGQSYSNIDNAVGMIACKWSFPVRPLYFDYFTRLKLASDPRLQKFKFIEY